MNSHGEAPGAQLPYANNAYARTVFKRLLACACALAALLCVSCAPSGSAESSASSRQMSVQSASSSTMSAEEQEAVRAQEDAAARAKAEEAARADAEAREAAEEQARAEEEARKAAEEAARAAEEQARAEEEARKAAEEEARAEEERQASQEASEQPAEGEGQTAEQPAEGEQEQTEQPAEQHIEGEGGESGGAEGGSDNSGGISVEEARAALNLSEDYRDSFVHGPKGAEFQKYIMLHDTEGDGDAAGVVNYWDSSGAGVASHFIVNKDGSIVQCVAMDSITHHAGFGDAGHNASFGTEDESRDDKVGTVPIGDWAPDYGMNSYSIGIEMVHVGGSGYYPEEQLAALDKLIAYIDAYYGFQSTIIDHKAWRSGNSDTSPEFAGYLANYQDHRTHA